MRHILLLAFLALFSCASFCQVQYNGETIEEILKRDEKDINVGIASLVLAKDFYPELNVDNLLKTFDYLAQRYNYFFGNLTDPDKRIRALNTYLYRPGYWNDSITFLYDDNDLQVTKLENQFINGYISTKHGSCITMPMLYVILGERLGFPIYPVRSAKHFFVRYIPERKIKSFNGNIEATNGGGYISDKEYKDDVLLPVKSIKNGVYLRSLSKKEYIASLLLINANEYLKQKNIDKAKHYLELSIKYDSTFSSAYWNYGLTLFAEARQLEEKLYDEKQNIISTNSIMPISGSDNKKINTVDQAEIMIQLERLEKKYEPMILAKIADSKKYKQRAESLGIVHKFPISFFIRQIESINKFKKQGSY